MQQLFVPQPRVTSSVPGARSRTVADSTATSPGKCPPRIVDRPYLRIFLASIGQAPQRTMALDKVSANKVYDGVLTKYKFKVSALSRAYFTNPDADITILECCARWFDSPIQSLHPCKRFLDTQSSGLDLSRWSHLHRRHRVRFIFTIPLTQLIADLLNHQCPKGRFYWPGRKRGNRAPFPGHLPSWCGCRWRR